jgi:AcrR family transcriptional regulator
MASRSTPTSRRAAAAGLSPAREHFALGQIEQIQRARILTATTQAADAQGVANLTVADVVTRAGVSRRTFYEIFRDCEDCLLAALEDTVARASARVLPAYGAERSWRRRIRVGLVALLAFFDEQPSIARLLVVEWLAAGPRALERRQRLLAQLASAVDEGRGARPGGAAVPELTAECVVGGVASVLHARLLESRSGAGRGTRSAAGDGGPHLVGLANLLMAMIVQPYLGAAAARRELEQALPETPAEDRRERAPEDVLSGIKMRLTYRTMRVLAAVAANPGASNRVIARAADVGDQGQISKLMMRLRKLGLLENRSAPVKGEPNAWVLSATGEQVERMLRS